MVTAPDIEALRPWLAVEEPDNAGEWSGWCPLHDDHNASASFNFDKGLWHCFAGCPSGEIGELIWRIGQDEEVLVEATGQTGGFVASVVDIREARRKRKRAHTQPLPTDAQVEGWHAALTASAERLSDLMTKRGLTLNSVRRWRLGWNSDEQAYVIPYYDGLGKLVNVKHYRLDMAHDQSKKMWGVSGHNQARLFPEIVLEGSDEIVISEGEFDTMLLNQSGFAAVTGTGGSGVWKAEWTERFRGKEVFICYDSDDPGVKGARKVAHALDGVAERVFIVMLPFDVVEDDGRDVTDLWLELCDDFQTEFKDLMRDARPFSEKGADSKALPVPVGVLDSFKSDLTGQALEMRVSVAGRTNAPYLIPRKILFQCTQDAGKVCAVCPLIEKGRAVMEVKPQDPIILEMAGATKRSLGEIIRNAIGAKKCDRAWWIAEESQNVEELFVRPAIDEFDEDAESDYATNRKIYSVGRHNTMPNTTVRVVGQILPSPSDQRSEFLSWSVDPTESSIDRFEVTKEIHERLKVFQPNGVKPLRRMFEIAKDLSGNVTQIYGRLDLHMAMDLVWHSALKFHFDGRLVRKGWLEGLIVGDTRTGKSEAAMRLTQHYRTGRVISCESATYAGIVGGLQQYGGKEWSVTWGAIPLNDRRLVVLDEVGGLTTDEIAQMSSIRSSGVAELTKIQQERTSARTRLIWIGNPRNGPMAQYLHGVYAVPELIGNPEDVARFDMALAVTSRDVPSHEINRAHRESVPHRYTWDLCRDLVLWAWSRKANHIRWGKGAEREVYQQAERMGERYVESPPLVQAANVREKIARVAVAIAMRTYSTGDGEHVNVTKRHVRDAVKFLETIYKKPALGYREVSKERIDDRRVALESRRLCSKYLQASPRLARFLRGRVGYFRRQDMEEMLNISREEANAIISRLWEWRMVAKDETGDIRAEPELNDLLRDMES